MPAEPAKIEFPLKKTPKSSIFSRMENAAAEDAAWKKGRTFSLVYYPGEEILQFLKETYTRFFCENGLNISVFPSLRKFETETVAMVGDLLNIPQQGAGSMTAGGTESILMAVFAARERARTHKPEIQKPEIIVPASVHPAFDKAAHYFDLTTHHISLRPDGRVDVALVKQAINSNTILIVGSAPSYPHGLIDPISELGELAVEYDIWLHVDACVGGMMLPFVEKLGYPLPVFDFRVPGVRSMSVDLHKYGYCPKGTSVILYRDKSYRKYQFFAYTEWTGGLYASATITGTRPGGAIASAWALINHLGVEGYLELAKPVMEASLKIQSAVKNIPGLHVLSNPEATVMALASDKFDIYQVADELNLKGWVLDRQQLPPSIHLTLSFGNTPFVEEFLADLTQACQRVQKFSLQKISNRAVVGIAKTLTRLLPQKIVSKLTSFSSNLGGEGMPKRQAAMYGMMGVLPNRGDLHTVVLDMLDKLNTPLTSNPDVNNQEP